MVFRRRSGSRAATGAAEPTSTDTAATTAGAATRGGRAPLTAKSARRMISVGRAVAPLLAPYALAAAGVMRASWDSYRASRLGVTPDQLRAFSGPGGALHARLSHVAEALKDLEAGRATTPTDDARTFTAQTRPRLEDLSIAVRAAEQMPSSRRRTAYRAIGGELDRIELALLTHLGVVG